MWKEYMGVVSTPWILSLLREDSKYTLQLVKTYMNTSLCFDTMDLFFY